MNYTETLNYLFSKLPMFHRIGAAAYKNNLDNSIALDNILNHPHKSFKSIHIAGTNGKGSTSNMLAAVLQQQGFKTGLFTSPHLKDFRERIRVNGKMIPKKYVSGFVQQYMNEFDVVKPSFFEWTVALAFDYFRHCKVDVAVIETGLGGRLDSTNIIQPQLSVITNIGWDHVNLLGDTLEKIAVEKAGIIKKNIPVLIGETTLHTKKVFLKKAIENAAPIYFASSQCKVRLKKKHLEYLLLDAQLKHGEIYNNLKLSLAGDYQLKNVATVLSVIELLKDSGFAIEKKNVKKALAKVQHLTGFRGRWQVLGTKPLIIADTGHNVDGIKTVIRQICKISFKKLHLVIGMVNDKDVMPVLKLLPKHAICYFCNAKIPRAMPAKELRSKAIEVGLQGKYYTSVKHALLSAKKAATAQDLIFVGGSTFTVAEVL
ncbi:MAG: bifunctional folylpolyglutamate synthase/dihydrofolate synthase [Bacteroidetes bacterium]|nr:bifunctional folylpolyglutamate synthase/dihydrofolate synthase [Bacteroidota bacterium]